MPTFFTRSTFRLRTLAVAQALILIVALAVPMAALASRTWDSATLNGGSSVSVSAGASITAVVNVTKGGSSGWHSTGWRISTTVPGSVTCVNHANHDSNGSYSESFSITAPGSAGTYDAYFVAYSDDACSTGDVLYTMADAVVVGAASGATKLAITAITPSSPIAGSAFSVTVQSQDAGSTPADVSAGTGITLSLNTGTGTLGGTLTGTIVAGDNEVIISGVTYTKAQAGVILTATRTSGDTLTPGNSAAFTVLAGAFSKLQILVPGETAAPGTATGKTGTPSAQTAGTPGFSVTVNAVDANWNSVSSGDTVAITTSDPNDTHPAPAALVAGTKTFVVTFATAGTSTVTATDSTDSGKTANTSPLITVNAGVFTKLQLLVPGETAAPGAATGKTGSPSAQTAGVAFTVTVNAVDANWNPVTSTNTVGITSSDGAATLPSNAALVAGTKTFSVTLNTSGSRTVTATDITDGTKTANTSPTITVVPQATSGTGTMVVSPTSVVAGSTGNTLAFTFTSPATTGFTAGSYVTLTVPSTWSAPTNAAGTGHLAVANTSGTSCAPATPTISGSGPWVVNVAQTCAGGNSFTLTYSSATAQPLAATATFAATSRSGSGSNIGLATSPVVAVVAGPFAKLQLLVPGETAAPGTLTGKTGTPTSEGAGAAFNVIVNAVDANWNLVTSTHTVAITSSDVAATLPASAAMVAGTKTFSVILNTVGLKTVTATDASDASKTANTSPSINVVAPALISLVRSTGMVAYGGSVGFSIQFTSLGAYRTIYLEHVYTGSSWTTVATLVTNASGFASTSYAPTRSGYYRVRFAGASDLGAAYSPVILVGTRQTVTLNPTHTGVMTIVKGRTINFRSTAAPLRADMVASRVTFRFYQKVAGAWVLKYERHVNADTAGTARTAFTFGVRGNWYVMAFADRTLYNAVSRFSQREYFLIP